MATYTWSTSFGAGTFTVNPFNPSADVLHFDVGDDTFPISAADVLVIDDGARVGFTYESKTVYLQTPLRTIATSNVTFADGSVLLVGDSNPAIANDNAANTLTGGAGNDQLNGLGGADTMIGGLGDDLYIVNSSSDFVDETGGDGTDEVRATSSHTLRAGVENLTLLGTGDRAGMGNSLANAISGNSGNNRLEGRGGNDTLDGGAGNDVLLGGLGNDVYVVDTLDDVVTDLNGQGIDRVQTSLTYTLTLDGEVEHLTLLGTSGIQGEGNDLSNEIVGNNGANVLRGGSAGNDTLDGGGGTDTLIGGLGNDTYIVNSSSDFVDETGGDGTDEVRATSSHTLRAGVENLTLLGTGDRAGRGNSLANAIVGNSGNNRLEGRGGNDTLDGGAGNDVLLGAAGNDVLLGAAGNDVLIIDTTDVQADGGTDIDTANLAALGATIDRTDAASGAYINIEKIDLSGGAASELTLDEQAVLDMGGMAPGFDGATLLIKGDAADRVTIMGWTQGGSVSNPFGETGSFVTYTDGEATLLVESEVAVKTTNDVDLATLLPRDGFRVYGADGYDLSGWSVSSAGDVNGDGFDDLVIGARYADAAGNAKGNAGESYVVFGQGTAFTDIDLASLGSAGFRIYGADAYDWSGWSVSSAGDVNGDGFDDLVIGALFADAAGNAKSNAGESYVVFGQGTAFTDIDLASLGSAGFRIYGADVFDQLGVSVSSAGDVNGDGFDDLVIGAFLADAAGNAKSLAGESYVVFGQGTAFTDIDLASLGSAGFRIYGADAGDQLGCSVSSAGDVNGDGFDDLIIAAYRADAAGNAKNYAGESYVIFGQGAAFTDIDLASLGRAGFRIYGADADDRSGRSVSAAGDVNGDGFDDVVIGARYADAAGNAKAGAGESYVVFGKDAAFMDMDLASLGSAGFRIYGADGNDQSGFSVSSAGDVNGDGLADLLVGARFANAAGEAKIRAGESYVIFGKSTAFTDIDLAAPLGSAGFLIYGADADDQLGYSVSSAGDVNGDGFDDLVIGAVFADAAGNAKENAGESYVIFGGDFTGGVGFAGTSSADTLIGSSAAETFVGGQGNDTLTGGGGADSFQAGAGDDTIVLGSGSPLDVDGGSGIDTVGLDDGVGGAVDLSGLAVSRYTNIEKIDLAGGSADNLVLDKQAVLDMAGSNGDDFDDNTLIVKGEATDRMTIMGWTQGGSVSNPFGETGSFVTYTDGEATLLVESEVAVKTTNDVDLATLLPRDGFRVYGADGYDLSGWSVSSAGDVNGDGFDDLVIGAYRADAAGNAKGNAGESYVVFGQGTAFTDIDLASLGSAGFRIYGADADDRSGRSVSAAGDVNGDGFDDFIIGALFADAAGNAKAGAGESYVVFGQGTAFTDIDLASLGSAGFRIYGADASDHSGVSVSSAGDVNGDGFDDLVIGAREADAAGNAKATAGESYVVFGRGTAFADIDLASLGSAGFRIYGADAGDTSGSASSAGDVNGDGFDDLIVGAYGADAAGNAKSNAGESYVIFGQSTAFADVDLALLGSAGFRIYGADVGDRSGVSVSSAGDVNGDGFDDVVIGAFFADAAGNAKSNAGESYVVFGRGTAFPDIDLAAPLGSAGFRIYGADVGDRSGSVSSAGDVNGDGFDDLIIGADSADADGNAKSNAGESYVIFGQGAAFTDIDLASLGSAGFRIYGADAGDALGWSVSSARDVNGDGFDDLIIGAQYADAAGNAKARAGESYVIFGGDFTGGVVFAGTAGADTLTGTSAAETFVGGQGNDTLNGGGGADAFQGGTGDDLAIVADQQFHRVDGGGGENDVLRFAFSGSIALSDRDGNAATSERGSIAGVEVLDLANAAANTLSLGIAEVLDLDVRATDVNGVASLDNALKILGEAGDTVNLGGAWTNAGANSGGTGFQLLSTTAASDDLELLIANAVTVNIFG